MLEREAHKGGEPPGLTDDTRAVRGLPPAEVLYAALWATTTDAVLISDSEDTIIHVNPRTRALFGVAPDALVGRKVHELLPERLRGNHVEALQRYLRTGVRTVDWQGVQVPVLNGDGEEVPTEVSFSEMAFEGQRLFVGFFRDISARLRQEAQRLAEREWAEATLQSIADAVVTLDLDGRIASLSVVAEHLTGWPAADAVGKAFVDVVRLRGEDGRLIPAFPSGSHFAFDFPRHTLLVRRDGHEVPVEGTVAPIMTGGRHIAGSVAAFRNVAQARRLTAELSYQASHDGLTGLVNRKAFERLVEEAVGRAGGGGPTDTLLYLDLDQFKIVNDTSGHVAGDALLQQLAALLKGRLRESDHIARLGGDEFGVLLHDCDATAAVQVAEGLRQTVADFSFVWEQKVFAIGVSIGIVHIGHATPTLGEVLARADEACYVAKARGRNTWHLFTPGDQLLALHHSEMEWTTEIRAALDEGRLFLCMQEIARIGGVSASTPLGEVLLRMHARDGSTVPPMAFIPAAERFGLMATIDRWVLAAVTAHMAEGDDDTCYGINLSAASISDPEFPGFVREQLAAPGIDARRIVFELTETAAIANLTDASTLMRDLKQRGVRFALDDFGSGMSSFAYLRQLPVDFLKIDGSFIRNIASERVDRAMVESINHLAHVMGIETIAEWVNDTETLEILAAIGVDFAQGHGISRPQRLR
jgi:diguanylate cyclase (GGDEF)-like protein/PAS domain S-box-containing protein